MAESHVPYFNDFLDDTFCAECGNYWPCVPARDAMTCKCSHVATVHGRGGSGECWSAACGCRTFRLRVNA